MKCDTAKKKKSLKTELEKTTDTHKISSLRLTLTLVPMLQFWLIICYHIR